MKNNTARSEAAGEVRSALATISGLGRMGQAASDTNATLDLTAGGHEELYRQIEDVAESALEALGD